MACQDSFCCTCTRLRVQTLDHLNVLAKNKWCVVCPKTTCFRRPIPAAWMINLPGRVLLDLMRSGMYPYERKEKRRAR